VSAASPAKLRHGPARPAGGDRGLGCGQRGPGSCGKLRQNPADDRTIATKFAEEDFSQAPLSERRRLPRDGLLQAKIAAEDKVSRPHRYVTIDKFSWSRDGFGTVMMAKFTIKNSLGLPVKDIEMTCKHSAPSGTEIDSNTRTIYDRIEANATKHVSQFNMGFVNSRATRSGCEVTRVTVLPALLASKPTAKPNPKPTVQKQTSSAPLPLH